MQKNKQCLITDIMNYQHDKINELISNLKIPQNKIIYIHAKIKKLKNELGIEYDEIVKSFISAIMHNYKPKTILVPTFTSSFTKSGIYHRMFSKSEVGRFSEETRLLSSNRTIDPVFSVVDLNNILPLYEDKINYYDAFSSKSLFNLLEKEDAIVMNFDLDEIVMSQLHYIEYMNKVQYRYNKSFKGIIYSDQKDYFEINYNYYVRDLNVNTNWNRKKIEEYLVLQKAIIKYEKEGHKILCGSVKDITEVMNSALSKDKYFLID
ncbi:AAC(3) family N-acetyltransferase [Sedimentibacter sp.]|uniref:AAC(3) family N-acetyltransferase n=1 Tax=Sedimentibacter sp. TaxID=1960295 RepID=UPI002898FF43|nr:AAC(3) family N-acetyltransferase [Sedimentibacter sp.]